MSVPQLDMQPLLPGCAVPGAFVSAGSGVQKSEVIPHWPQISQQAFKRHGFNADQVEGFVVGVVPFTCGPQRAFGRFTGKGGFPVLRHITAPICRSEQPIQPHVWLLLFSMTVTTI